ncbi:hypothetical protein ACM0T4_004553, partial [Escherichia coli]
TPYPTYKITLNQAIALSGVGLIRRTSVASGIDVGCGVNALSDLQNHAKSGYCAVWRRPDKTRQASHQALMSDAA